MKLIRARATEWEIKPERIGMLGFSAGGNLCVMAAVQLPPAACLNFIVPVYPTYLTLKEDEFTRRPEI